MKRWNQEPVQAVVRPVEGKYLKTRVYPDRTPVEITVGVGEKWTPLACKEVYGKGVKAALEQETESCLFDLTEAAKLKSNGIYAALEGIYGGAYKLKFALSGRCEPELTCYACGEGWKGTDLEKAENLARRILQTRNLVNLPPNLLTPMKFAEALRDMARGLPVEVQVYDRAQLKQLGLNALLAVGDASENEPCLTVLRYNGAPDVAGRLGYVGKGVTCDTGGYCLKPGKSMEGMKGDMAGGAAVAAAVCALAENGVPVNVTAVIPACENRISGRSLLPGDVITGLSGQTIEVLNTDAEGRLILSDALTWTVRQERANSLVDVATLTGAIYAMLGHVAIGTMTNDELWYDCLKGAAEISGERIWQIPDFPEYEKLIESDLADVRNTSKDGCGAITAGLFLKRFVEKASWVHLDIAGAADSKTPVWEHQVGGAHGAAVSTLYHLGAIMGDT